MTLNHANFQGSSASGAYLQYALTDRGLCEVHIISKVITCRKQVSTASTTSNLCSHQAALAT